LQTQQALPASLLRAVDARSRPYRTALEHDVVIEIRLRAGAKGAGRVRVVGAAQGEGLGSEVGPHPCAMRLRINGAPKMVLWVATGVFW
jgi:hypothetical protein